MTVTLRAAFLGPSVVPGCSGSSQVLAESCPAECSQVLAQLCLVIDGLINVLKYLELCIFCVCSMQELIALLFCCHLKITLLSCRAARCPKWGHNRTNT